MISRELLDRSNASGSGGIQDICDDSITPVLPSTSLEKVLPLLSEDEAPLPVVDEDNNFVGVATQKDLLKVVASGL